jgi:hypothetical protein
MNLDDFLKDSADEDDDVLIRMQHKDGTTVTFLTAPPEVFTEREQLEPLLFGISETDICVAFNSDLVESMIDESVEKNGEFYGAQAAAFLPITMILNKGLKAVDDYVAEHKSNCLEDISSEIIEQKSDKDDN